MTMFDGIDDGTMALVLLAIALLALIWAYGGD